MENKNKWFSLTDIDLDIEKANDFNKLKIELEEANCINVNNGYGLYNYRIKAKLIFNGKLNTPSGEVDTEFTYYIKSKLDEFIKEAKIDIYEQTFTGLDLAVTVKFSSGSIISKIVFGDIEKAYTELKECVYTKINEYNKKVKEFNKEIEEAREKQENEENN